VEGNRFHPEQILSFEKNCRALKPAVLRERVLQDHLEAIADLQAE